MFFLRKCVVAMLIITFSSNITLAQQIQTIQISPGIPSQTGEQTQSGIGPSKGTPDIQQETKQSSEPSETAPADSPSEAPADTGETLSEFEQFISGKTSSSISTNLRQFGYKLFRQAPSTFAPVGKVPVGPGYVIGPGDQVNISVWGKVEGRWNVVVDRDGNISLPKAGVIGVTGLTFSELKTLMQKEFSKYYTGFEMNVSMGSLRAIKVYVVGNAQHPGAYTTSSLATMINVLIQAGGPSKMGTMRDIQLKRNGKTIAHFDLYEFLLEGDKTQDARLMPEDVIFIPPIGPLVGIAGNVRVPAIYELLGDTRLLDLIHMAGGFTSTAFKGRVQRQRIENHHFRTLFEDNLRNLEHDPDRNFVLMDGDLIKIFSVIDTKNTVTLAGAVVSPGDYAVEPGITRLKNVLSKAGGALYYASTEAELTRVTVTPEGPHTEFLHIDIAKALNEDPAHNIPLEINDYLFVRTVPDWRLYEIVSISGEVKFPGRYTIKKGETMTSLIERAGGYTDEAYLRGAVFVRERVRKLQQENLQKMVSRLERELLVEGSVDVSTSLSAEEVQAKTVELEQQRKFIEVLKQLKANGRMSIRLAHLRLLKGSEFDIKMESGDRLYIPMKNNVVNVLGSVMSRTSFVYSERLTYEDYITMAGGFSTHADKKKVYVLKVDGTAMRLSGNSVKWNSSQSRWELTAFGEDIREIEPGDSIIVPEKLDRIAWMREIKDLTTILFQVALATAVVIDLLR
jgi:protein involved in polysaccharide export with SLBB domain